MNKYHLLLLMGAATLSAGATSKFDAGSRLIMDQYQVMQRAPLQVLPSNGNVPFDLNTVSRGQSQVSAFVTLADGGTAADLEALGFEIKVDCDNVLLISGTLDAIAALDNCDAVESISFGETRKPLLDLARTGVGADVIQAGTEFENAYKGSGIITGIYDVGFDANHANFRDNNGTTRIGKLWRFTGSEGGFREYSNAAEIATFTTDNTTGTHGTHTTGCMAGSFNRRGGGNIAVMGASGVQAGARFTNPYYGMAPEATIAAGCGPLYDANIITAVDEIIKYSQAQGKPCVVNLSIGSTIGPHDGTDATSQALAKLGEKAIICIAAGNEGDMPISITKTFTAADNSVMTFFAGNGAASGVIDIYSNSSETFDVDLMVYDRNSDKVIYTRNVPGKANSSVIITTSNYSDPSYIHDDMFDRAFRQSNIQAATAMSNINNRYYMRMQATLTNNTITNANGNYVFGIKITGKAGQLIHMTTNSDNAEFTNFGMPAYADGSGSFSISSMACGENTLCVGAWNTRKIVPCIGPSNGGATFSYGGWGYDVDSIAGYSSWGVLYDGRKLPDVCAPGTGIISSISKYYYDNAIAGNREYAYQISANQTYNDRTNQWEVMQGTSMATPIVAGSIALWLQVKPDLTIADVKKIVKDNSRVDQYVTGAPFPVQWGAGKFDALKGMRYLITGSGGIDDVTLDRPDGIIARPIGDDNWEILVPSARDINVALYNTRGQMVASASGTDSSATLSTAGLPAGIYIVNANGLHSTRVVVR